MKEPTTMWRRAGAAPWARRWLVLVAAWACAWPAGAELSLFPTRIVLEKNQRSAQVELLNRGTAPETYRISVVNRRMTVDGDIVLADNAEPDERFAEAMVRYSPRQVTLQPGQSQTVRVLLRKPAELAAGEYRSHLQFDRVEAQPLGITGVMNGPLAPGGSQKLKIVAKRYAENDPQPIMVRLSNLPAGISGPDSLQIPPGETELTVELRAAAHLQDHSSDTLVIAGVTRVKDADISIETAPVRLEVKK